jgi:hypothetical protein
LRDDDANGNETIPKENQSNDENYEQSIKIKILRDFYMIKSTLSSVLFCIVFKNKSFVSLNCSCNDCIHSASDRVPDCIEWTRLS